ncbi:MAG: phosphoribosylformylglycinamidine synthase subunit PurS [Nitrososphaerota archaeon]|jgi:phosphoribosylformylglycinamidine synthase|nr:phosphoribosylformylglycinamidine synthase subunit PurS [Nitrososphaerota archaeon]
MKYTVKIDISLKPGHNNPEGEATTRMLKELNYPVEQIAVHKIYVITFQASSQAEAKLKADEMCTRLLTNPVRDNYTISVVEQ